MCGHDGAGFSNPRILDFGPPPSAHSTGGGRPLLRTEGTRVRPCSVALHAESWTSDSHPPDQTRPGRATAARAPRHQRERLVGATLARAVGGAQTYIRVLSVATAPAATGTAGRMTHVDVWTVRACKGVGTPVSGPSRTLPWSELRGYVAVVPALPAAPTKTRSATVAFVCERNGRVSEDAPHEPPFTLGFTIKSRMGRPDKRAPWAYAVVSAVTAGSPAARAGLVVGVRVVAVNGNIMETTLLPSGRCPQHAQVVTGLVQATAGAAVIRTAAAPS